MLPPDGLPDDPHSSILSRVLGGEGLGGVAPEWSLTVETKDAQELAVETPATKSDGGAPSFRLTRMVGRGGMGEVWEAEQVSLRRLVAVKRLRTDKQSASDETRARRLAEFQREALVAASLEHPNVVPVHDQGKDPAGAPLLAMKLVRGEPWNKLLRADFEKLGAQELLAKHLPVLIDMAQAVAFAHSRGIVHRDLKPAQVMVGEFGEVLLMDWGLAVFTGEEPVRRQEAAQIGLPAVETASNPSGTPVLMAPEQTDDDTARIGPWTDIYLLGGTLYCLLTGSYPHSSATSTEAFQRAALGIVQRPAERAPERPVPPELEALCMQCLAADPAQRPGSAQEFISGINDFLSGSSKRKEASRLAEGVQGALRRERFTYARATEWLADLARARELWPGGPAADLEGDVLAAYAQAALKTRDLTLARVQAERLHVDDARRGPLLARIDEAMEAVRRGERVRGRLRIAVVALVAVVAAGSMWFSKQVSDQRDIADAQAQEAVKQRRLAEAREKEAVEQRTLAEDRSEASQYLVGYMLQDLGVLLDRSNPRDEGISKSIADRVVSYLDAVDVSKDSAESRRDHSNFLTKASEQLRLLGHVEVSGRLLDQGLELQREVEGPDSIGYAQTLYMKAIAHLAGGETAEARRLVEESERIIGDTGGLARISVLQNRASLLAAESKFEEALASIRQAVALARVTDLGEGSTELAECLARNADLAAELGHWEEAEAAYKECIGILSGGTIGEEIDELVVMNNLSALYLDLGRFNEAEEVLVEVVAKRTEILGPLHSSTCSSKNNLANVFMYRGEFEKALPLMEEVVAAWSGSLGEFHPETIRGCANLAAVHFYTGHYREVVEVLSPIVENYRQSGGTDSVMDSVCNTLGLAHSRLGELGQAEEQLRLAVEIAEAVYGVGSEAAVERRAGLAAVHSARGQHAEALALYAEDYESTLRYYPADHTLSVNAALNVVDAALDSGDTTTAREYVGKALASLGDSDEALPKDWITALRMESRLLEDEGELQEAVEALRRARVISESLAEDSRHRVVVAGELAIRLGRLARTSGDGDAARRCWQEIAELGALHEDRWRRPESGSQASIIDLAEAHLRLGERERATICVQWLLENGIKDDRLDGIAKELGVEAGASRAEE